MSIKRLKISPSLEGKLEFEVGKNQVKSIKIDDEIIKIKFENHEDDIESINIPTEGWTKIKLEKSSEWDTKLVAVQGFKEIYYKKATSNNINQMEDANTITH